MSAPSQPSHDPHKSTTEDLCHALLHLIEITDQVAGLSLDGVFARLAYGEARV